MSIELEEPLEPSCDCEETCKCPSRWDDDAEIERMRKMFQEEEPLSATEKNRQTWWGQDATRILDYIELHRGNMSDFEVLEDIMCGSYVDELVEEEE